MAGYLLLFKKWDKMGASTTEKKHKDHNHIKLTKELINQYRKSLEDRGCGQQTISMYFCYLNRLYEYLQGDKELSDENIKYWVESLKNLMSLHMQEYDKLLRREQKKVG